MTQTPPSETPNHGSSILFRVLIAVLSQVVIGVVGITAYRVIAGEAGYAVAGLIFFAVSLNGVVRAVLDLGVSRTVIREMSILGHARHRQNTVEHFLALYLFGALVFFACFILWLQTIFPGWFARRFEGQTVSWSVALMFGVGGFGIITSFLQSLLIGVKRINMVNYFETASTIIVFGFLMASVAVDTPLAWIGAGFFLLYLLKMLAQTLFALPALGVTELRPRLSRRVFIKTFENLRFNLAVSGALVLHKQMDKIIATIFLPLEQVGFYTIIQMSLGRVSLLTQSLARVILPEFSTRRHLDQKDEQRFMLIAEANVVLTVPLYVVFFLFSDQVGLLLVGGVNSEDAQIVSVTVQLLSLYFMLNSVIRLHRTLIAGSRHVRKLAVADTFGVAVSSPLVVWLTINHGLVGLAAGMVTFFLVSGSLTLIAAHTTILVHQAALRFLALAFGTLVLSGVFFAVLAYGLDAQTWPFSALIGGLFAAYLLCLVTCLLANPPLRSVGRQMGQRLLKRG